MSGSRTHPMDPALTDLVRRGVVAGKDGVLAPPDELVGMKDNNLTLLRGLLTAPIALGCLLMILSMPQIGAINHEIAMMFLSAGTPCSCLQIYLSLPRIEGDSLNMVLANRGDQQWFAGSFVWVVACLAHCVIINGYNQFIFAFLIFINSLLQWKLLWVAQRKRLEYLQGKPPGSPEEKEDIGDEIAKMSATIFFSFYNVFSSAGCVGTNYDAPEECLGPMFAQLFVVGQVGVLFELELLAIRGGIYSFFEVVSLQIETRDMFIVVLIIVNTLIAVFVFSTSRIQDLYYAPGEDGHMELTTFAANLSTGSSIIWFIVFTLCHLSYRRKLKSQAQAQDMGRMKPQEEDRLQDAVDASRDEEQEMTKKEILGP